MNNRRQISTFIVAALTADGLIAKNLQHASILWTSKEDKEFFNKRTKKAGAVVMGSNTYETIGKPLKGRLNIVYSKGKQYQGVEITQKEPKALIEDLERRGYREVAICGGSTIYTMFMQSGLVDKLYLTIESVIFGSGMSLFNKELNKNLHLVSVKKIGKETVLLEYNVVYEINKN